MKSAIAFETGFDPCHGGAVSVAENVLRVTAPNASPYTFQGTNSYIIGQDDLMVLDPGPDNDAHLGTLVDAIGGRKVSHILISHTHADHSPLAARLKSITGAVTVGYGPHVAARHLHQGETNTLDASADCAFFPDVAVGNSERIVNTELSLSAVHTPGHTANHLCFALEQSPILFSGDHVMAWATTIVAPPDGSMSDYMASLDLLIKRNEKLYFPGHGGPVNKPARFLRGLKSHRIMRETAILDRLKQGDSNIFEIVLNIYRDLDPRLHGAAALTVFAHLERLIEMQHVLCDGPARLDAQYRKA